MRALAESLAERRAALVARGARQRAQIAAAAHGVERAVLEPLTLGLGVAGTVLGASPRLRGWFVRAWMAGALVRRLLGR